MKFTIALVAIIAYQQVNGLDAINYQANDAPQPVPTDADREHYAFANHLAKFG